MPESPIAATPYEVLRISASASDEELRVAYRRRLRETHPDTGGDAVSFSAVQQAWALVGTTESRARYDRGHGQRSDSSFIWAPHQPSRTDSRPRARAYGHPGGWRRERYLTLMREWMGRGENPPDPYDPALVRSAPRELRHILADALSEESTARALAELGIGYTIWHDVSTGQPEQKIDHIVLGPPGLFAILSENYGTEVRIRKGELLIPAAPNARPIHDLGVRAKVIARAARVKFSGLMIVLPDDELSEGFTVLGSVRGATTAVVSQSRLPGLLRDGLPGERVVGGTELFDVRTRLQASIRFV